MHSKSSAIHNIQQLQLSRGPGWHSSVLPGEPHFTAAVAFMIHVQRGTPHGVANYSGRSCELVDSTCFGKVIVQVQSKINYLYYNRNLMQILQNKTIPQNFCVSMGTQLKPQSLDSCVMVAGPALRGSLHSNALRFVKWMARTSEFV